MGDQAGANAAGGPAANNVGGAQGRNNEPGPRTVDDSRREDTDHNVPGANHARLHEHGWGNPSVEQRRAALEMVQIGTAIPLVGYQNALDTRATFEVLLPEAPLYRTYGLASTELVPFSGTRNEPYMYLMAVVYAAGKILHLAPGEQLTLPKCYAVAIGEVMAPNIRQAQREPRVTAHTSIVAYMRAFLASPNAFQVLTLQRPDVLVALKTDLGYGARDAVGAAGAAGHEPARNAIPDLEMHLGNAGWADRDMTAVQAMRILSELGRDFIRSSPTLPLKLLVLNTVAVLKKGNASPEFCNKIVTGVCDDLAADIALAPEEIDQVAKPFRHRINREVAQDVIEDWLRWTPETALRLRLTIMQCAFEGLTGFTTIQRTIREHPSFPWGQVCSIPKMGGQMTSYTRITGVINDNCFAGFNQDISDIGIKNYHDLASACKDILRRCSGDQNIGRARCFKREYQGRAVIDALIEEYNKKTEPTENTDEIALAFVRAAAGDQTLNLAPYVAPVDPNVNMVGMLERVMMRLERQNERVGVENYPGPQNLPAQDQAPR